MAHKYDKKFRGHLGGFNKDDVNNYIRKTDMRHSAEIEELNAKIEESQSKIAALEEEKASLSEAIEMLVEKSKILEDSADSVSGSSSNAQTEALFSEIKVLKSEKKALAEENAALNDRLSSYESDKKDVSEEFESLMLEKDLLAEENAALKDRIAALEAAVQSAAEAAAAKVEEKAEEPIEEAVEAVEEVQETASEQSAEEPVPSAAEETPKATAPRTHLGFLEDGSMLPSDVINNAEFHAQNILSSAERESEARRSECDAAVLKIRSQTEEQAYYIRDRLAKTAGSLLSNVNTDISESIGSCIRELKSCVDDMETEILNLLSKMSSRSDEMNERITYYQNYLSDGIEETMRQINKKADGDPKND